MKVRYFYYGDRGRAYHNGIITVAYKLDKENNKLIMGMSFCSPKDRFNKKLGRTIANGRMKKVPIVIDCNKDDKIIDLIMNTLKKAILVLPKWCRKLIKES